MPRCSFKVQLLLRGVVQIPQQPPCNISTSFRMPWTPIEPGRGFLNWMFVESLGHAIYSLDHIIIDYRLLYIYIYMYIYIYTFFKWWLSQKVWKVWPFAIPQLRRAARPNAECQSWDPSSAWCVTGTEMTDLWSWHNHSSILTRCDLHKRVENSRDPWCFLFSVDIRATRHDVLWDFLKTNQLISKDSRGCLPVCISMGCFLTSEAFWKLGRNRNVPLLPNYPQVNQQHVANQWFLYLCSL